MKKISTPRTQYTTEHFRATLEGGCLAIHGGRVFDSLDVPLEAFPDLYEIIMEVAKDLKG